MISNNESYVYVCCGENTYGVIEVWPLGESRLYTDKKCGLNHRIFHS